MEKELNSIESEFDKYIKHFYELLNSNSNSRNNLLLNQFKSLIFSILNLNLVKSKQKQKQNNINHNNSINALTLFISTELSNLLKFNSFQTYLILNLLLIQIINQLKKFQSKIEHYELEKQTCFERLLESILIALKALIYDERSETPQDKIGLGKTCFQTLASLLVTENIRVVLQRRVLDIFEYATESCVTNKALLAQQSVLCPHTLAVLIASSTDAGLTERCLELAFRLGREVVGKKRQNAKERWEEYLFPLKLYPEDRIEILNQYRTMTNNNYEETSTVLLEKLSHRTSSSFKYTFARTLNSNGMSFENNDGDPKMPFGSNISINQLTFTAVTTKEIYIDGDQPDYVQLLLETDLSNVEIVEIEEISKDIIKIQFSLFNPPTLDSILLEEIEGTSEIMFEINSTSLPEFKLTLASRKLKYKTRFPSLVQTLPTPKITPRIRNPPREKSSPLPLAHNVPQITSEDQDQPQQEIIKTPPRKERSSEKSTSTNRKVLEPVVPSTSSSILNPKSKKRKASEVIIPVVETKRLKGKNVAFNSIISEDINSMKDLAPYSDDIGLDSGIAIDDLEYLNEDTEIRQESVEVEDPIAVLSSSSLSTDFSEEEAEEEILKSLEGISKSTLRSLLAKGILGEVEGDTPDVITFDEEMIEIDALDSGKGSSRFKVDTAEVEEKEISSDIPVIPPSTIRIPPRLNLIVPTPSAPKPSNNKKSSATKSKKTSTTNSQRQQNKQAESQEMRNEKENKSREVVIDGELANVLGLLSSIVLQKLALNTQNVAQSFDARIYNLEANARKLSEKFYFETEEFIQATEEVLNIDQIRNESKGLIKRSSDKIRKLMSQVEQLNKKGK